MKKLTTILVLSMLSMTNLLADNIQILSAVTKDKVIPNAEVILQKAGQTSTVTSSNNDGQAIFSGFGDTTDTTLIIKKDGFSTLVAQCPCDGLTYALSPKMKNLDGLRVVLTWGKTPADLDSHLAFKDNHIYFSNKRGQNAHLDVDDTTSFGPETITIVKKKQGENYLYAVHDFTSTSKIDSKELSMSRATVHVYIGKTLVRTYKVTKNKVANVWIVFAIDKNGAFKDINNYLSVAVGSGRSNRAYQKMKNILKKGNFTLKSKITTSQITEAKRLNTKGEKIYHEDKIEDAMYLFQKAINLNPEFGQAYSNLGLTYQKLDRNAEALWANRKAIQMANGKNKKRVKASSYYNIAKIYEKQLKYEEALQNYNNALSNKEHSAYRKGIKRMNKNLGL